MSDNPEIFEVANLYRLPGAADYDRSAAKGLVGEMVKSNAEAGVYGRIIDVQGYIDREGSRTPLYGVVVEWTQKPKAEIAAESVLFRRDIEKHYPLVYGNERDQAKHLWETHQTAKAMKAEQAASLSQPHGRGK